MNTLIDSILSINLLIFEILFLIIKIDQTMYKVMSRLKGLLSKQVKILPIFCMFTSLSLFSLTVPFLAFSEKLHAYP